MVIKATGMAIIIWRANVEPFEYLASQRAASVNPAIKPERGLVTTAMDKISAPPAAWVKRLELLANKYPRGMII